MENDDLIPKTIVHIVPGQKITSYKRYEELGHGGFAKVFRATNELTGESVAIKVTSKERLRKPKYAQKQQLEVEIQRSLNHPNIVKALDYFEDGCYAYLVLELCECSLKTLLRKRYRFTESQTVRYLRDIIAGVSYLHDNRIIHRDLKLENFLMDKNGHVKIADFGLSAKLEHDDDKKFSVCGTPNYLSPEMITDPGKGMSYEVDIWAIGVSAFAMLTGRLPFQARDKQGTYAQIKNCKYDFPTNIVISKAARQFVEATLKVDPKQRPTALELSEHPVLVSHHSERKNREHAGTENQCQNSPIDVNAACLMMPVPDCFVSRFCDQSEKYGLGYLLINGTVGACFNDSSRMVLDPHQQFIQYWDTYTEQVPEVVTIFDKRLAKKIAVLMRFSLSLRKTNTLYKLPKKQFDPSVPMIHVKYWYRTEQATLFRMDDRNIQVNFSDRKKLIIFWTERTMMVVPSLFEQGRLIPLSMMNRKGLESDEKSRFLVAKDMLTKMSLGT